MDAPAVKPIPERTALVEQSAELGWEAKTAELEKAFRKLNIRREETATAIPYESLIPGIARELMLMGTQREPDKRFRDELQNLARLTGCTIEASEALDHLSPMALDALNYRPAPLRELQATLRKLRPNLRILQVAAKTAKAPKRERSKKVQPRKLARFVALHYFLLTGERPTRRNKIDGPAYGPFLELLNAVYGVLGVKASADAVLKSGALNSMEFNHPKSHI